MEAQLQAAAEIRRRFFLKRKWCTNAGSRPQRGTAPCLTVGGDLFDFFQQGEQLA